jgi:hypothetical protein
VGQQLRRGHCLPVHRPAADRKAADGDRQHRAGRCRGPRCHRQGE